MKGKILSNIFDEQIKEKYKVLNLTDEQFKYFFLGLKVGAECMETIWINKTRDSAPTSYNIQIQIADLFLNNKTLNSEYLKEQLK